MSTDTFSNLDKSILQFGKIWSLTISTKFSSIPKDKKFKLRFCQPSFFQAFLGKRLSLNWKETKRETNPNPLLFKKLSKASSKKIHQGMIFSCFRKVHLHSKIQNWVCTPHSTTYHQLLRQTLCQMLHCIKHICDKWQWEITFGTFMNHWPQSGSCRWFSRVCLYNILLRFKPVVTAVALKYRSISVKLSWGVYQQQMP